LTSFLSISMHRERFSNMKKRARLGFRRLIAYALIGFPAIR